MDRRFGESNVRILSAEQSQRILEVYRHPAPAPQVEPLARLITLIGATLDVKAALVTTVDARHAILAETRTEPRLPPEGAAAWAGFGRLAAMPDGQVQLWSHDGVDWTLIRIADVMGSVVLALEGDWTLSAGTLLSLARNLSRPQALPPFQRQSSIVDPLSGLFTRQHFRDRMEEELLRADRHQMPLALLMIDLDDFGRVNERFGHRAGDTVIRGVAEVLRDSVRRFDVCALFGAEEFAILMPGSGPEHASLVAERIRQRIEAFRSDDRELSGLRVTASLGLSHAEGASSRELIDQAAHALLSAKRAGKNRVVGWFGTPIHSMNRRREPASVVAMRGDRRRGA